MSAYPPTKYTDKHEQTQIELGFITLHQNYCVPTYICVHAYKSTYLDCFTGLEVVLSHLPVLSTSQDRIVTTERDKLYKTMCTVWLHFFKINEGTVNSTKKTPKFRWFFLCYSRDQEDYYKIPSHVP